MKYVKTKEGYKIYFANDEERKVILDFLRKIDIKFGTKITKK